MANREEKRLFRLAGEGRRWGERRARPQLNPGRERLSKTDMIKEKASAKKPGGKRKKEGEVLKENSWLRRKKKKEPPSIETSYIEGFKKKKPA